MDTPDKIICPYCKKPAVFVDSKKVYGRSYGMIYLCDPCKAWVGVHKATKTPLGRLANAELRQFKKEAHKHFDIIWKSGLKKRYDAYGWLSEKLGLERKETHIGMFDVSQCKEVVRHSKQMLKHINSRSNEFDNLI